MDKILTVMKFKKKTIKRIFVSIVAILWLIQLLPISTDDVHQKHSSHRSLALRTLSKMTDNLHAYQREAPIGAGMGTSMLLGIFSMRGPKSKRRRELIRRSYLDIDERVCTLDEYKRQAKETPNQRTCQVPYTFVIGGGGHDRPTDHNDNQPLILEDMVDKSGSGFYEKQFEENDCTFLNIKENMEHGKSSTYLKYATSVSKEYGIDFIAKTDDDTVLGTPLLLQFIDDDLPPFPYNRRMYGGSFVPSRKKQSIYAQGQFYFMSVDLADYVANQLTPERREDISIFIEDLDMGNFINSMERPIKYLDLTSRMFWLHPRKEEEVFIKSFTEEFQSLPHLKHSQLLFKFYCPHWLKGEFHI